MLWYSLVDLMSALEIGQEFTAVGCGYSHRLLAIRV